MRVEFLEDRCTPATINVTSLADFAIGVGHTGVTLRDAIEAANTDTSINGSTAGSGADVITFDSSLFSGGSQQVITLLAANRLNQTGTVAEWFGPTALRVTSPITIQGPTGGNGITLFAQQTNSVIAGTQRLFTVASTGNLTMSDLTLSGGVARGGDGAKANPAPSSTTSVSGGGLGAGGAIFSNQASVTLDRITFVGNSAVGGSGLTGGTSGSPAGGVGGGGMGASGSPGSATVGGGPNGGTARTSATTGGGGFAGGGGGGGPIPAARSGGPGGFGGGGGSANNAAPGQTGGGGGFGGGSGTGNGNVNVASAFGGGTATTTQSGAGAGLGGAIFTLGGTLIVNNSTFYGNAAIGGTGGAAGSGIGGAIFNADGVVTVNNSTLSGNTAAQGGRGVYSYSGSIQLYPSSYSGSGGSALNLSATSATLNLNNTIIGQSDTAVTDVGNTGTVTYGGGNNLVRGTTNYVPASGPATITVDPQLSPLASNDGLYRALIPASASVLGAGASGITTVDQFGTARGATIDLGALQLSGLAPFFGSARSATFTIGSVGSFQVVVGNGPVPSLTGSLPAGLSYDSGTGILSGTPTGSPGTYSLTFSSTNAVGTRNQAFTLTTIGAADLAVTRIGDVGGGALSSAAFATFVDRFATTGGAAVQTIALPTTTAATGNGALTIGGSSVSEGALTRSQDGRYLLLGGYNAAVGTASVNSVAGDRIVARIDATGAVDTTTRVSGFTASSAIRSAASVDGSTIYSASSTSLQTQTFGSTTSTSLGTFNGRVINVANNQLYVSASTGSNLGLNVVGSGLPTSGTQTVTIQNVSTDPYGYYFMDRDASVPGVDSVYVVDQTNGLSKFSFNGLVWVPQGSLAGNFTGVVAVPRGSSADIYVTSGTAAANTIVKYTDAGAANTPLSVGSPTTIKTAAANTVYRGLTFFPTATKLVVSQQPASSTPVGTAVTFAVTAQTSDNVALTNYTGSATITLTGGTFASGQTLTQNFVSGVATFTVQIDAGTSLRLNATSDSLTGVTSDAFDVVANSNTAPVITSNGGGATASIDVAENTTAVTTVTATDIDTPPQMITYSKSGPDAGLFDIDSMTGVLTFHAAPDYEDPRDVGRDNVYNVTVTATDNGSPNLSGSQDLAIHVTDLGDTSFFTDASVAPTRGSYQGDSGGPLIRGTTSNQLAIPLPTTGPRTDTVDMTFDVRYSLDGGTTLLFASAPASATIVVTPRGGGATGVYDTEMTALTISGGSLPSNVRLRESPTLASLGVTTVAPVTGGYTIGSFFDVFTELSLDGGATWAPTAPTHLTLHADPTTAPPIDAPTALLLPPTDSFASTQAIGAQYASGVVIKGQTHEFFSSSMAPPALGQSQNQSFDTQVDMQVSFDGGTTFQSVRAPATVGVKVTSTLDSGGTRYFDTEMLSLSITGGGLPGGVMVRESPTLNSSGAAALTQLPDGTYRINSFFDVFTELSVDGGATWLPSTIAPDHVELQSPAAEISSPSSNLPAAGTLYASPVGSQAAFAGGFVVKDVVVGQFSQTQSPPAPGGSQNLTANATVSYQFSTDGGATFAPGTSPATVTIHTASLQDSGATRYFDTEMLQLTISGGSLPAALSIRESPTKASSGRTSVRTDGGSYKIDSFFDVFTELSTDGGATWSPTTSGPLGLDATPTTFVSLISGNVKAEEKSFTAESGFNAFSVRNTQVGGVPGLQFVNGNGLAIGTDIAGAVGSNTSSLFVPFSVLPGYAASVWPGTLFVHGGEGDDNIMFDGGSAASGNQIVHAVVDFGDGVNVLAYQGSTFVSPADDTSGAAEVRVEKFNVRQEFGPQTVNRRDTARVLSGATLGGSGPLGAVELQAGATLAPAPVASGGTPLTMTSLSTSTTTRYVELLVVNDPGRISAGGVDLGSGTTLDPQVTGTPTAASFTIIDNTGTNPVSGTFVGLPEGSEISLGGVAYTISYMGGDGNDVVLTRNSAPVLEGLNGGSTIAVGDVTGDGVDDVVYGSGPGTSASVSIYDGVTNGLVRVIFPFGPGYVGGVTVAVKPDGDGDAKGEIVVGQGSGGSTVLLFDAATGRLLDAFDAFDSSFTGGVNVAAGDVDGDGIADVVVGQSSGGNVFAPFSYLAYNKRKLAEEQLQQREADFLLPNSGVSIAIGSDFDGDGKNDLIVGQHSGGSRVDVVNALTGVSLGHFDAFATFAGGVNVAAVPDVTGDGKDDIVVAPASAGLGFVGTFNGITFAQFNNVAVPGSEYSAMSVAGGDDFIGDSMWFGEPLSIEHGGTGSSNIEGARYNLQLGALSFRPARPIAIGVPNGELDVAAFTPSDSDAGQTATLSLGGPDASHFEIVASPPSRILRFQSTPAFLTGGTAEIAVIATDPLGGVAQRDLAATVMAVPTTSVSLSGNNLVVSSAFNRADDLRVENVSGGLRVSDHSGGTIRFASPVAGVFGNDSPSLFVPYASLPGYAAGVWPGTVFVNTGTSADSLAIDGGTPASWTQPVDFFVNLGGGVNGLTVEGSTGVLPAGSDPLDVGFAEIQLVLESADDGYYSTMLAKPGVIVGGTGRFPIVTLEAGATLKPAPVAAGATPLTFTSLTLQPSSTVVFEFDGALASRYNLQLGSLAVEDVISDFVVTTTPTAPIYVLIENDTASAISGVFEASGGGTLAEGAIVSLGGVNYAISYVGGDGNDVTLTRVASTWVSGNYPNHGILLERDSVSGTTVFSVRNTQVGNVPGLLFVDGDGLTISTDIVGATGNNTSSLFVPFSVMPDYAAGVWPGTLVVHGSDENDLFDFDGGSAASANQGVPLLVGLGEGNNEIAVEGSAFLSPGDSTATSTAAVKFNVRQEFGPQQVVRRNDNVLIRNGATGGGTGTYPSVSVGSGGTLAPGNSPGALTTFDLAFNAGSTFAVELNGPAAGTQYDQVSVAGTVTIASTSALNVMLGYSPANGQQFKIIDNDGTSDAVVGTFAGLAEGAAFTAGGHRFTISYHGGDNNDVVLTVADVAPTVTGVSPFVGPTSGGTVVVITGTYLDTATAVMFGGVNAASYTINTASQITAVVPAGSEATVDVVVTNPGGNSATAGAANDFTYAQPAVTSVVVNGGDIVARNKFGVAPALAGSNSVVEQIEVTFNQRVKLDAGAFAISSLSGAVIPLGVAPSSAAVSVTATGVVGTGDSTLGFTQYVLTFDAGPGVHSYVNAAPANNYTTLFDGFYQLDMIGSLVHAGGDIAADRHEKFWALYGASNPGDVKITGALGGGDDTLLVDGLALNDIYHTFGSSQDSVGPPTYSVPFDWDLDGDVDGVDLSHLYANFGTIWKV